MIVRAKGQAIRIALADPSKPQNVQYVLVEPSGCWSSTFNAWGKKQDQPIVNVFGKLYRVNLEEIA